MSGAKVFTEGPLGLGICGSWFRFSGLGFRGLVFGLYGHGFSGMRAGFPSSSTPYIAKHL